MTAIISEINLLVYHANDLYDYTLISQGLFIKQISNFSPKGAIERVMKLFAQQADICKARILFDQTDSGAWACDGRDNCLPD